MSVVRDAARSLGGDVVARDSILAPGPGHSPRDRSLSVRFTADGGLLTYSHAGDDWRTCREHVESALGLPAWLPDRSGDAQPARPVRPRAEPEPDNSAIAARPWREAAPIASTLGERYWREVRGIRCPLPPTMRYLAARGKHPAAIITASGIPHEPEPEVMDVAGMDVRAVHPIRLHADGSKLAKIMLGPVSGRPLVVAPWTETGRHLVIAEGIEDALTAHEATGFAAWAGGSAAHMGKLAQAVPEHVEDVVILEDDNIAGRTATARLADALATRGIRVAIWGGQR